MSAHKNARTPLGISARRALRSLIPPVLLRARDRRATQRLQQWELVGSGVPFGGSGPLWSNIVRHVDVYAEWGMGQSTVLALKTGCSVAISVETAPEWIAKVDAAIGEDARFRPVLVDLGPVGRWGRPLSYREQERFDTYFEAPFRQGWDPDLVLIDGRFRVACWASAMLNARPGTLVVFDDYVGRGHYEIVAEVVRPIAVAGRQAVFCRPLVVDVERLEGLLRDFRFVMD